MRRWLFPSSSILKSHARKRVPLFRALRSHPLKPLRPSLLLSRRSQPQLFPAPPRLEEPREEERRAIPRVVLPSVESAKTAPLPEREIVPSALPQPGELVDLAEVPMERATAPSPDVQTELHDVSPEAAPVTVLEPLVREAPIDPLLALQLETEFSETLDEHRASRSLLMRAIGMLLLLTLIAAGRGLPSPSWPRAHLAGANHCR